LEESETQDYDRGKLYCYETKENTYLYYATMDRPLHCNDNKYFY